MKIMLLLHVLLIGIVTHAQENDSEERFIKVEKNKHYGLFDTIGKQILEPIYDKIRIDDDVFIVNLNNHCSFINRYNGETLNIKYDDVNYFHEGLAMVEVKGKYGYVNRSGKMVIKPIYSSAWHFSEGLAMVELENTKQGFIDKKGKIIIPFQYDNYWECFQNGVAVAKKNNKMALIDKAGKELIPYKYDEIFDLYDEFYEVRINNRCGIIDKKGNEIIAPQYGQLFGLKNGKIRFNSNYKFGTIDIVTGKEIFSFESDDHEYLSDENTIARQKNKYGVINNKGDVLIDFKYNSLKALTEDFVIAKSRGKLGILNLEGREILGCEFDHILACSEDIFAVGKLRQGEHEEYFMQLNIIDKNMKKITSATYLNVGVFSEDMLMVEYGEGVMKRQQDGCFASIKKAPGKWGFINKEGIEVVVPQYTSVKKFSEGLAAVKDENGNWGFIDKSGNVIIPMQYEYVQNFTNKQAIVYLNKKWGLIDKTGKIVIPIEYDSIDGVSIKDYDFRQPYESYFFPYFLHFNDED